MRAEAVRYARSLQPRLLHKHPQQRPRARKNELWICSREGRSCRLGFGPSSARKASRSSRCWDSTSTWCGGGDVAVGVVHAQVEVFPEVLPNLTQQAHLQHEPRFESSFCVCCCFLSEDEVGSGRGIVEDPPVLCRWWWHVSRQGSTTLFTKWAAANSAPAPNNGSSA